LTPRARHFRICPCLCASFCVMMPSTLTSVTALSLLLCVASSSPSLPLRRTSVAAFAPPHAPTPTAASGSAQGALFGNSSSRSLSRDSGVARRAAATLTTEADRDVETLEEKKQMAGLERWDPQVWVAPAVHNRNSVRLLALLSTLLLASGSTVFVSKQLTLFVHLLAYATWLGSVIYTTFVAGITMFRNLPRKTFGRLQSKLFPLYFQLCTGMLIVLLTTGGASVLPNRAMMANLAVALVMTLANLFVLEPKSTEIMFKR